MRLLANAPLLLSYSDDGTPVNKVMHKVPVGQPSGQAGSTFRKGKQSVEALVQVVFLRYIDGNGACTSAMARVEGQSMPVVETSAL